MRLSLSSQSGEKKVPFKIDNIHSFLFKNT